LAFGLAFRVFLEVFAPFTIALSFKDRGC
jgi:hypothetical protein